MLPLLLLALLLAAPGLNGDVIWFDELTSISHAGGVNGPFSPQEIAESVSQHSPKHTPLFFDLLALWAAAVGWHQAVLRALTLVFGLLALALVYRIGAEFISARAGFYACAFLAANVFWMEYWHEIRMYSLQFALIAALVWHYFRVTSAGKSPRWRHWAGLTVCAALSLYAQPFSIFFLLALGILHLRALRSPRLFWQVALAMLVAALLYLPWLPVTLHGMATKFDTASDAMPLSQALEVCLRLLSNGQPLLLLIPLLGMVAAMRLREGRRALPFLFLAAACLLILLVVNEWIGLIPLRRARYFLLAWGMLALAFGAGLAHFRPRWIAPLFIIVYAAAGFGLRGAADYPGYQGTISALQNYPPLQHYVALLREKTYPHDFVVGFTTGDFVNRGGKRGKSTADYYFETLLGIDGTLAPRSWTAERLLDEYLPTRLANNPYLLFVHEPQNAPGNLALVQAWLERDYLPCEVALDSYELVAQRYAHRLLGCGRERRAIHYDNGIRIVDRFGEVDAAAQTVRLVTGWEVADKAQLREYNVSLQLLNAAGQNVAQTDRHLYDHILKWYAAELPSAHLPAGDYRAVVILYDRTSKAKVGGVDVQTGEARTIFPILQFTLAG